MSKFIAKHEPFDMDAILEKSRETREAVREAIDAYLDKTVAPAPPGGNATIMMTNGCGTNSTGIGVYPTYPPNVGKAWDGAWNTPFDTSPYHPYTSEPWKPAQTVQTECQWGGHVVDASSDMDFIDGAVVMLCSRCACRVTISRIPGATSKVFAVKALEALERDDLGRALELVILLRTEIDIEQNALDEAMELAEVLGNKVQKLLGLVRAGDSS